jgi:hypothetical protein
VNSIRQEGGSLDEDDLNGSFDEDHEYDEEARLSAASKKKNRLSWKDAGLLRKLHAIVAYIRSSELLYNEFLNAVGYMILIDNDT